MPRSSKTKEWPNNNKIAIYLKDKDTIQYFETDEKGRVRTKKRAWARHGTTVILETPNVFNDRVEVEEEVLVFECEFLYLIRFFLFLLIII